MSSFLYMILIYLHFQMQHIQNQQLLDSSFHQQEYFQVLNHDERHPDHKSVKEHQQAR